MTRVFLTALTLCAGLIVAPAHGASRDTNASTTTIQGLTFDPVTGEFTDALPPEGGWQAFARLLDKITPSVNTGIPLSASQVTDRIAGMIDDGHAGDALKVIQERESAREQAGTIGVDVQLQYQKARAMAALGRHDEAMALWRSMTENYPELPEPWNALAVEYARQGQLGLARDALNMALASDPAFAPALENLGHVQMALAQQAFARAKALQAQPAPRPDASGPASPPVPGSGTGTVSPPAATPAPAAR